MLSEASRKALLKAQELVEDARVASVMFESFPTNPLALVQLFMNHVGTARVTNHRLKAVALVTGCKPCSGQRPAR